MQLTPEVLRDFVQHYADERVAQDRSIFAAYLRGQMLYGSPLLGGCGDLDIVFIHNTPPDSVREIVRLTNEIHYDIEHHDQSLYQETRQLRVHPWLGPTMHDAEILSDPRHFLDFIQAGVRGLFHDPEHVYQRSQTLLKKARRYWLEHHLTPPAGGPQEVWDYLETLQSVVNSLALLDSPPFTTRRLGTEFAERAQALDHPQLYGQFLSLLGGERVELETVKEWLPAWEESISSLPGESCPVDLHLYRVNYYLKGMESVITGEHPKGVLWPLMHTWTRAAQAAGENQPARKAWQEVCCELGLDGEQLPARLEQLDRFLEEAESITSDWAKERGVS